MSEQTANYGEQLRQQTAAVRICTQRLGMRRQLTPEQSEQQANLFHADPSYLSGSKRLLNHRHPALKEITKVFGKANALWKAMTVPYPERGIRLIRRDSIPTFEAEMRGYLAELQQATQAANEVYRSELVPEAQERLGDLFAAADYPPTLENAWVLTWDFPSVEPPEYLKQLNPALYEREKQRIQERFDEAVRLAEQGFAEQFAQTVQRLVDGLTPRDVHLYQYTGDDAGDLENEIEELQAEANDIERQLLPAGTLQWGGDDADERKREQERESELESRQAAIDDRIELLEEQLAVATAEDIERREAKVTMRFTEKPKTRTRTFGSEEDAVAWLNSLGCEHSRTIQEQRKFHDSHVTNLQDFFERFRQLSVGSNQQLDELVEQAKQLVGNADPQGLRNDGEEIRRRLRQPLSEIAEQLDAMLVTAPDRLITLEDEL